MKLQRVILLLLVGLGSVVWAKWPPQSLLGKVTDVSTGKGISGVQIIAYYDGTSSECEAKSDSSGAYRIGIWGVSAVIVYSAYGYRVCALRWPDVLSPSLQDSLRGWEIREVSLEPMRVPED